MSEDKLPGIGLPYTLENMLKELCSDKYKVVTSWNIRGQVFLCQYVSTSIYNNKHDTGKILLVVLSLGEQYPNLSMRPYTNSK